MRWRGRSVFQHALHAKCSSEEGGPSHGVAVRQADRLRARSLSVFISLSLSLFLRRSERCGTRTISSFLSCPVEHSPRPAPRTGAAITPLKTCARIPLTIKSVRDCWTQQRSHKAGCTQRARSISIKIRAGFLTAPRSRNGNVTSGVAERLRTVRTKSKASPNRILRASPDASSAAICTVEWDLVSPVKYRIEVSPSAIEPG